MRRELIETMPYNKVEFRWVSEYYDININGTCIYKGKLCEFVTEYPSYVEEDDEWSILTRIYKLDIISKMKWYYRQWIFEKCVGYHCTIKNKKRKVSFYYRKPKWLYTWLFNLYYKRLR